jgi:D-3-phosphoglycerate dehydrogenase / 2-oxoglutarate reductase
MGEKKMGRFKVLITDYEYETLQHERDMLQELDVELVTAQCRSERDVIDAARDADGIINQYAPISRDVIESLERCRVISRYGIGVDTVDLAAATQRGIVVSNVTDYCVDEVADHAMALLLSSARKVAMLNRAVKSGSWDYKAGVPIFRLRGRVLGLVGFGKIPQNLSVKARAFGLEVIAYDPFVPEHVAQGLGVRLVGMEELCAASHYISVHLPLTSKTRHFISEGELRSMRSDCILINTSRGPVIDEHALARSLQNGELAGAALDVLEKEPIERGHPLLSMEQAIINPHVAWYSEESQAELQRKAAQNVRDVLAGFYPDYIANPEVLPSAPLKRKAPQQEEA